MVRTDRPFGQPDAPSPLRTVRTYTGSAGTVSYDSGPSCPGRFSPFESAMWPAKGKMATLPYSTSPRSRYQRHAKERSEGVCIKRANLLTGCAATVLTTVRKRAQRRTTYAYREAVCTRVTMITDDRLQLSPELHTRTARRSDLSVSRNVCMGQDRAGLTTHWLDSVPLSLTRGAGLNAVASTLQSAKP